MENHFGYKYNSFDQKNKNKKELLKKMSDLAVKLWDICARSTGMCIGESTTVILQTYKPTQHTPHWPKAGGYPTHPPKGYF